MKKKLRDLTKDDWYILFPIELVDHNPEWITIYENEKKRILNKIEKETIVRIEHFGSSSIPRIKSKAYIDLMIEVSKEKLFDNTIIDQFTELGYSHFIVPKREAIETYSSFEKGYNLDGTKEQVFHIHMSQNTM
ncbi:GrpB family protein [Tenacibaculum sp. nBUS_03]|uniref:GrpB family protein n=1 Tax=Tenacibaculum sp. nBUS_03 TaxID=3395320 RepID=UPI003EC04D95